MDLFTYGTLMSPEIMMKVAGCQLVSVPVTLSGYQRSLVRGEVYPGITEVDEAQVDGVLYLEVPAAALQRLDVFGGEMYERRGVTVQEEGGIAREAMTYVFRPEFIALLTNIPWDFAEFLASGKKRFVDDYFGLSEIGAGEKA